MNLSFIDRATNKINVDFEQMTITRKKIMNKNEIEERNIELH